MILLNQMIAFAIFMMIGFYIRKKGVVDAKGAKALSWLVSTIANPALIIYSVISADNSMSLGKVAGLGVLSVIYYGVLCLIGLAVPKLVHAPENEVGTYRNLPVYSNIGFMGIPLMRAYFGPEAVSRVLMFIIVYNVYLYSAGIMNFQYSAAGDSKAAKFNPKNLLNVGIIASVIAIILNFVHIPFPPFATVALEHMSNMTAALSMICIGTGLATCDLKSLFTDMRLIAFSVVKMLIFPIIGTLLIKPFVHDEALMVVLMLLLATPVGSMLSVMSDQYDPECTLSVRAVALTSLMAVITVPLVSMITGV